MYSLRQGRAFLNEEEKINDQTNVKNASNVYLAQKDGPNERERRKGKSGYKMITIRNKSGRVTKKSKKRLSRDEIKCIKKCQFVPGLFKDCQQCLH